MLDTNLIFKELDDLLDEHYVWLTNRKPGQVQVYKKATQLPQTPPVQASSPASVATSQQIRSAPLAPVNRQAHNSQNPVSSAKSPVGELVANIFMLVLLTMLSKKPTK